VARHAITVNAVCPGWVLTDLSKDQLTDREWCETNSIDTAESIEIARLSIPQMEFTRAEDVASLVTYLCGESARGITGQAINICGGLSLH
jgi:3-hydroxybutyrate dehydrogenase